MKIVSNQWRDERVVDSLTRLFDEDGTVYLITGYFTSGAYQTIRPDIERFLSRSPENELVVIVSPTADQFNPSIGRDLLQLDDTGRVRVYKYPDGCLHAKLFLRTGEHPLAIVGSVNLTRAALEQNVELSVLIEGTDPSDERMEELTEWTRQLIADSEPISNTDLLRPVMVLNTISVWRNKAKLLPRKPITRQPVVYLLLVLIGFYIFFLV